MVDSSAAAISISARLTSQTGLRPKISVSQPDASLPIRPARNNGMATSAPTSALTPRFCMCRIMLLLTPRIE
jgi:hypothetical protein